VVPVLPPPPVVLVGVLFVVVGCDDVVGGWVTGAGAEFVVGAGADDVVTAAPPLLELPPLELLELEPLLELLELLLAVVAVVVVFFFAGLCFFGLFAVVFVVGVVGVVAAAFVVELEVVAAPPQPATASASAITTMGTIFLIRRVPPRYGVDGPGYKRLVL
jgi:hypothetical protein